MATSVIVEGTTELEFIKIDSGDVISNGNQDVVLYPRLLRHVMLLVLSKE